MFPFLIAGRNNGVPCSGTYVFAPCLYPRPHQGRHAGLPLQRRRSRENGRALLRIHQLSRSDICYSVHSTNAPPFDPHVQTHLPIYDVSKQEVPLLYTERHEIGPGLPVIIVSQTQGRAVINLRLVLVHRVAQGYLLQVTSTPTALTVVATRGRLRAR